MMTQPNLDYLFQVTAPLVERPPSGAGSPGFNRAGFGDHLAHASGSTPIEASRTELRERPAPSGPLERNSNLANSDPVDDGSSDANSSPEESGACAEASQPAACGGDDSSSTTTDSDATDASAAEASSNTTSADESTDQDESEADVDDNQDGLTDAAASGAEAAGNSDAAAIAIPVALTDDMTDVAQSETVEGTEHSSGNQRTSTRQQGNQSTPGNNSRKLDVELKSAQQVQADVTSVNAETQMLGVKPGDPNAAQSAGADTNKASRKPTPAKRDSGHVTGAAASDQAVSNSGTSMPTKGNNVAHNARRASDKVKSTDESRRRSNEKSESRGAQRTESTAVANQTASTAFVSDVRVDTVASTATKAGDDPEPKAGNTAGAKSDALLHPLARANRGHGTAGRAGRAGSANELPRVDTTRFVGRVAKAIQTANERGGALQLRLSPPELGSLRLQITVHEGVMTASLEAESHVARQLLLDHLPSLRDRLAEQNIRIDRFDVDVRQEGSGGQPDARASQHEQQQPHFQNSTPRREAARTPNGGVAAPGPTSLSSRTTNNGLNVLA